MIVEVGNMSKDRRTSPRQLAFLICALAFTVLPTSAIAQSSGGTRGSETDDQRVAVSEGDSGDSSTSGGSSGTGGSCGSEVTVVTDHGTSHPSSGECRPSPASAPVSQQAPSSSEASTASAATPAPGAESTPTVSPAVVQSSPIISLQQPTPVSEPAPAKKKSGMVIPFALVGVALALAVAGYLIAYGFGRVARGRPKAPLNFDPWRDRTEDDHQTVRVSAREHEPLAAPVPMPPPTEPIAIGGDSWWEQAVVPGSSGTTTEARLFDV